MKKILSLVLALALTLSVGCAFAEEEKIKIGVVQYMQHVALDAANEGFVAALEENGYGADKVDIDQQNAQGDASNLSTIADKFVNDDVDLVLAIATPAAQVMAGRTTEIPILGTAITDYVSASLVDSNEVPGGNVSGTSDMNPVADQIALLKECFPETKTVGVLYTSSEDNSILQAAMAKEAIEAAEMEYVEVTVNNTNDVQQAVQEIVTKCDAIYIPTDNVFAASMPIVYGATAETKTPVIAGEAGMTMAGGYGTLGISYYELGYQTGLMAIRVLEGEDVANMPIEMAAKFDYTFNKTIADEFGLAIPEQYAEYAQEMTEAE